MTNSSHQLEGGILDWRQRRAFEDHLPWVLKECERLGLFQTRMLRFTQMFFYDFNEQEQGTRAGQLSGASSSRRAARVYLLSGKQLQSTCGILDSWYWFVDDNRGLFNKKLGKRKQEPQDLGAYKRPDERFEASLLMTLKWEKIHR